LRERDNERERDVVGEREIEIESERGENRWRTRTRVTREEGPIDGGSALKEQEARRPVLGLRPVAGERFPAVP
jgi:hypothetical protein